MGENLTKVYVNLDSNNVVIGINSSIFISDTTNWTQIDKGTGDKYVHAQGNYLEKSLMDMQGKYNYKLVDGKLVLLTEEEKEKLFPTQQVQLISEETLAKEVANILIDNMKKETVITNALQTIANLKVEIMGLKGGNA